MTAPDPRLGEIEARLSKATPGPWEFSGNEIDNIPDYASDNPAPWTQVMECEVSCMSYCYGGSINMTISEANREFIAAAPADIAYLLAELRKAQDALGRVEAELVATEQRTIDLGWSGSQAVATVASIRAAVAAATGGES